MGSNPTSSASFDCTVWRNGSRPVFSYVVLAFAFVLVALALVALVALALSFPRSAYAAESEYRIDSLSTDLYVETDASVHIITREVITYAQPSEGYIRYLHKPENHESLTVLSVRAAPVDDKGALTQEWTELELTDHLVEPQDPNAQEGAGSREESSSRENSSARANSNSRSSIPPELRTAETTPWYSFDATDGTLRAYFPADSGSFLIETDYLIANRVRVFRDVGELYWRYVNSNLPVDAPNISLKIALPLPAGEVALPDETVYAWGHGPQDGTLVVGEDGSVTYSAAVVPSGHYAECHVLFPASWLPNVPKDSPTYRTERRLSAASAEEAEWADANARGSIWDNQVRSIFSGVAIAALLLAIIVVAALKPEARARQWLFRIAFMLLVVTGAVHLFFKEPITTAVLLIATGALALMAALLPVKRESSGDQAQETSDDQEQRSADRDAGSGEIDAGRGASKNPEQELC